MNQKGLAPIWLIIAAILIIGLGAIFWTKSYLNRCPEGTMDVGSNSGQPNCVGMMNIPPGSSN